MSLFGAKLQRAVVDGKRQQVGFCKSIQIPLIDASFRIQPFSECGREGRLVFRPSQQPVVLDAGTVSFRFARRADMQRPQTERSVGLMDAFRQQTDTAQRVVVVFVTEDEPMRDKVAVDIQPDLRPVSRAGQTTVRDRAFEFAPQHEQVVTFLCRTDLNRHRKRIASCGNRVQGLIQDEFVHR